MNEAQPERERPVLALPVESLSQSIQLIVQVAYHRALGELWVFLKKGVQNLIVLAHRIVEPLRQMKGEDSRLLHLLAQLIDELVKTLIAGDLGYETVKTAVGVEVAW